MPKTANAEKKRKIKGRKTKKQIGLPNAKVYNLAAKVLGAYIKRFNLNIVKKGMDEIDRPFVALANHSSRQDWIYVGLAMLPDLLNVVVSHYYYTKPKLGRLLKMVGAIPKQQFCPDVGAIKSILSVASKGGNIMLFPEGRTTPSGESETFERSTVKLLRHLKMPVVAIHMDGSYFTMPKWNFSGRPGRVDINVFPLLTVEEMDSMTDDEIYERMCGALYTDEFAWQKKNHVAFKGGDCAEGLEHVLYKCPKCGEERTTRAKGDTLICEKCGNGTKLNEYYEFEPLNDECVIPENISEWYKWELAELRAEIEREPDFTMHDGAGLKQNTDDKWLTEAGSGYITLTKEGFVFSGTRFDDRFELKIPLKMLPAVACDPCNSFEIVYQGTLYSFIPDTAQTAQKWAAAIELMNKVHCGGRQ